jgi:hypothetical protein
MVHSGFEPRAVAATFGTWPGFLATACLALLGRLPGRRRLVRSREHETQQAPQAEPAENLDELELPILS